MTPATGSGYGTGRLPVQIVRWALGEETVGMGHDELSEVERLLRGRAVDLDEVLRRVVEEATRRLGADRGTLYLVDHARGELVSHIAQRSEIAEIRLRLGEGVAGWVAAHDALLNVPAGTHDARFAPRIDEATGYRTRTLLAAPLRGPRGVIGVVQLLNKRDGLFDAGDEAELSALAARIGELLSVSSLGAQLHAPTAHPLSWRFNHLVGDSPAMRTVYERAARAARTDASVLVRGESGAGKELVARAVHDNSARAERPFVVVDLSALPGELALNELFGHVRGAYTGADRDQPGRVQAADGGTLFLDEIGDASPEVQRRLLRLLQERTYHPVGASAPRVADVRFVFATHRDLEALVDRGEFRGDLYYRLRVVEIVVPPLRERGHADLDRLIDHFLFTLAREHRRDGVRLSPAARQALHAHPWPGNVRELRHVLESAVVLGDDEIGPDLLSLGPPGAGGGFTSGLVPLRELEAAYVRWVVARCDGNQSEAARRLGIGRNTLARKLA